MGASLYWVYREETPFDHSIFSSVGMKMRNRKDPEGWDPVAALSGSLFYAPYLYRWRATKSSVLRSLLYCGLLSLFSYYVHDFRTCHFLLPLMFISPCIVAKRGVIGPKRRGKAERSTHIYGHYGIASMGLLSWRAIWPQGRFPVGSHPGMKFRHIIQTNRLTSAASVHQVVNEARIID
jgi:hypothetical protein